MLLCVARLAPRFSVEQEKEDGSVKVRPIDNFSWCAPEQTYGRQTAAQKRAGSVNGHSTAHEKLQHDHLDKLAAMVRHGLERTGQVYGVFKARASCTHAVYDVALVVV